MSNQPAPRQNPPADFPVDLPTSQAARRRGFFWAVCCLAALAVGLVTPGLATPALARPAPAGPGGGSSAERDGRDFEATAYTCWNLEEALQDLRSKGVGLIWSSDLVRPDMQIRMVPDAPTPSGALEQILTPFGLTARHAADQGVYLVVRDPSAPRTRAATASRSGAPRRSSSSAEIFEGEGILPIWLDRTTAPVRWTFPSEPMASHWIPGGARFLVVEVTAESFADWERAAFELKTRIVDAGAESKGLLVALSGKAETLERLVAEGLAPYVNAYVHSGTPWIPAADPTARSWYVHKGAAPNVLQELLSAADRGDALVSFESIELDPWLHAFLLRLQSTPAADLNTQPQVFGVPQDKVRFFLEPESGNHYLAFESSGRPAEIRFHLPGVEQATALFPDIAARDGRLDRDGKAEIDAPAELDFRVYPGGQSLEVGGRYPYYLVRLSHWQRSSEHGDVNVESTELVDPYEKVVANQVFQERELEKFHSLDVMEYISSTPQYAGGDQITWEHRILQRKGKLSEYHHLGYWRNGVRYPESKLLEGRLFRNEALLQLRPLEVELDETYSYSYLGIEKVGGREAYRIAFRPLRRGTTSEGNFVRGELWLDRENDAHLRIRTYQEGLEGPLVFQDRTVDYEWIFSGGECFWDWRERKGNYVVTSLGRQYPVSTQTERTSFSYNRPDIDEIAQTAYESDLMIHVESPPEGHRWLVKKDGERRLGELEYEPYPATGLAVDSPSSADSSAEVEGEAQETAGRVLADVHAFSSRAYFSLGGFGQTGSDFDLFPGIVLTDTDLFGRGIGAFVGAFKDYGLASMSLPNALGKGRALTITLDLPWEGEPNEADHTLGDGTVLDTTVETFEPSLTVGTAIPINRRLTLSASYSLRQLAFERRAETDPEFVLPADTVEHVLDFGLSFRLRHWSFDSGVEYGGRPTWEHWGYRGEEALRDSYHLWRLGVSSFYSVGKDRTLGAGIAYYRGFDLDRFSRLRGGRSRAGIVGFSDNLGFDEGLFLNVTHGTNLFSRLPINLRLDASAQQVFESIEGVVDRVGFSFRFLVNGPFETDIWPSIRYAVFSSRPDEEGDVSYGLSIRRRY